MDHAPALPRTSPRLIAVLIALAVVAIAVPLLVVLNAPRTVPVQRSKLTPPPQRVIPKAELPPVEPAEFVALAQVDSQDGGSGLLTATGCIPRTGIAASAFSFFPDDDDEGRR